MGKTLVTLFLFAFGVVHAADYVPLATVDSPLMVMGTWMKGSNFTEPRPKKSRYLGTKHAGLVVIEEGVGYYLAVHVLEAPEQEFHIKISYQNPLDTKRPMVNVQHFPPSAREFIFSTPKVVSGIKGQKMYSIKVEIFESPNAEKPIDVLKQKFRAYVDTTTSQILINENAETY